LRVVHVVPALFGEDGVYGGAERYAFELARHMAACTPTALVTFGARDRRERIGGIDLRVIGRPTYVRGQRGNPIALRLFSELRHADVVHCHQRYVLASSLAALYCRLTRRRAYVTDHGGGGWDISSYVSTERWYDAHLHVSNYSRQVYGHDGKTSAHVIFGGTDTARFSPAESAARGRAVAYVGRLLPHKGINDLVNAIPPAVPLRLIGRESDKRFLEDLRRLAAGKRVTFEHNCADAELVTAYREAACVVLPSVYRTMYGGESSVPELLGQTLLEAMACAAPVICSAVASMPEIVDDGVTGLIVPPNDPHTLRERINWLLEHPREAAAMGQAGRRKVLADFTWPAVVRRCLDIYAAAA
jgi:glycosyltransferase involved in cell wall biosynthesis